jgi:hypothetical protein
VPARLPALLRVRGRDQEGVPGRLAGNDRVFQILLRLQPLKSPDGGYLTIPGSTVVRGPLDYTAFANGHFQPRAAVGAKLAMYRVMRECYAVPSSPLYRVCKPVAFIHDEIFSEIWLPALHEAALRKQAIMEEAMREVCPDVKVKAEPAAALRWYKAMSPVYDANGRLIPWEPAPKKAA